MGKAARRVAREKAGAKEAGFQTWVLACSTAYRRMEAVEAVEAAQALVLLRLWLGSMAYPSMKAVEVVEAAQALVVLRPWSA